MSGLFFQLKTTQFTSSSRYFMGQLNEIATVFYELDNLNVRILESRNDNAGSTSDPLTHDTKTVVVKYRLDFDNRDYVSEKK